MTLVIDRSENNNNKVSTPNKVKTDKEKQTPIGLVAGKEAFKADLKQALNDAIDIIEGKKPRKTLKDIFNE